MTSPDAERMADELVEAYKQHFKPDLGTVYEGWLKVKITTALRDTEQRVWREVQQDVRQIFNQRGVSALAKINQVEQLLRGRATTEKGEGDDASRD